jgi:Flp pilus assembly pilin Flp
MTWKNGKMSAPIVKRAWRWIGRQSGQSLVEYTLILAFIFIVCIGILRAIGPRVNNLLGDSNDKITNVN